MVAVVVEVVVSQGRPDLVLQVLVYTVVGPDMEGIVCDLMYDLQHRNLFLPFSGDPREENQTCKRMNRGVD